MDDLSKYQFGGAGAGNAGYQFPVYDSMYVDDQRPEIAETLSNRYDANKAEYDALQRTMGAVQTLKGDQPVIQDLQNRVEGNLEGVVNSGRYEFGNMAVSDSVTDFMTDKNLISASESWENRQKELEVIAQRRANGMQSYDFGQRPVIDPATGMAMRDPKTGEIITEHVTDSHVTSQQGVYQPLSENKLPAEEKARQLMQGIRDNPILLGRIASSNPELAFFLRSGKAVTGNKIAEVAEAVLPLYMDSSEGMQKMRALQQLTVNDATGGLHDSEEAADVLFQDLISAAAPQRGSDYQYVQSPYMTALTGSQSDILSPLRGTRSMAEVDPELASKPDFDKLYPDGNIMQNYQSGKGAAYQDALNTEESQERLRKQRELYPDDETFYKSKGISTPEYSLKRVTNELAENGGDLLSIHGNDAGKVMWLINEYEDKLPQLPGETQKDYATRLWEGVVQAPSVHIDRVYTYSNTGNNDVQNILHTTGPRLQVIDLDNPTTVPMSLSELEDKNSEYLTLGGEDFENKLLKALGGDEDEGQIFVQGMYPRGPLAGQTHIVFRTKVGMWNTIKDFNLVLGDKNEATAAFREIGAMADVIATGKQGASRTIDVAPKRKINPATGQEYTYDKITYTMG